MLQQLYYTLAGTAYLFYSHTEKEQLSLKKPAKAGFSVPPLFRKFFLVSDTQKPVTPMKIGVYDFFG